ncbi:endopygalactorunase [Chitinophaga qingshengii]|uniref:Endopygalactorunase n=1 Tax=Chitinophaga qingshengii TaxID=1569794 RepID=A0ABR7TRD3_9BACT|nr:endopygalactorunase [Chitinophaga qingshengii]MBC9932185.1 endopygalactorunase [Chitinophaga qingshengii]
MKSKFIISLIGVLTTIQVTAVPGNVPLPRVTAAPVSPHIASVSNDIIRVVTGSTYAYTVDTPEKEGLVSTATTVKHLMEELELMNARVTSADGKPKDAGVIVTGDKLILTGAGGSKIYYLLQEKRALTGRLELLKQSISVQTRQTLTLHYTAGQRSPDATVTFDFPRGITITPENTTVNVIGRGAVLLKDLGQQSIGRTGTHYSYKRVGEAVITHGGTRLTLSHLDLRPANGPDIVLTISNITLTNTGSYPIKARYTTSQPDILTSSGENTETAMLRAVNTIADFERVIVKDKPYHELADDYTKVYCQWSPGTGSPQVQQSTDSGRSWSAAKATIDRGTAIITHLQPGKLYLFRLAVKDGPQRGFSNTAAAYTGLVDTRYFGITGSDTTDHTNSINAAIRYLHDIGGGTLLFSEGNFNVRTIHLQSNVYLYVAKKSVIRALRGADAPETTWFSDKAYRSGLSPTDPGPYEDPENYLTKQDVGHHYFHNAMFFGERLDNIKIIGNGLITGNGNLVTSDKVMNNAPDKRADKMFSLKLCTNVEIGGIHRDNDLWYSEEKDAPYYVEKNGAVSFDDSNMLQIDRAGHFVLLATGTDTLFVHNTHFGKMNQTNVRDIYDFMACNQVTVRNIYSRVSSDDIIKPGSDCSLGFTRPARHYRVRNVIGDTNCNLFQVGSETVDDIMDVCVDNIWVLGANKAGFSISTNDGAHVKDIHLNCGHTGPVNQRSRMMRTTAPFFISISNRGRVIGATVGKYTFTEDNRKRTELLVQNVNIGQVENIFLNSIDITEVYSGSSFGNGVRWKPFDGSQARATSIIAGYSLPASQAVEGGLDFTLPDGRHTGYIRNVMLKDVHITSKGGHPLVDTACRPPELGVGQYNVSNLKIQPAYGLWARHVVELTLTDCSFNYEKRDSRYALFLDDVKGATLTGIKAVKATDAKELFHWERSAQVRWKNTLYYQDEWGKASQSLIEPW